MARGSPVAAALVMGAMLACSPAPSFKATDISAVRWGGDFELTAHNGSRVKLSQFNGQVVVLFFGYTHCPDICAPTLAKLNLALQRLGAQARRVQVLFITVDPAHDNVERLAAFVPRFNPTFLGLTGTEAEIAAVAKDYKMGYAANPKAAPGQVLIDHASSMLVRDTQGKMRLLIKADAAVEDIAHDLLRLLSERH